jgi:hypothetical protein
VPSHSEALLLTYRLTPGCNRWPILDTTKPERHWALLATIPRELIILNDYEPDTEHFPISYRNDQFAHVINNFSFSSEEEAAWDTALDSAKPGTYVLSWGVPNGRSGGCEPWVEPPLQSALRQHYALRYEDTHNSQIQIWQRSD